MSHFRLRFSGEKTDTTHKKNSSNIHDTKLSELSLLSVGYNVTHKMYDSNAHRAEIT